MASINDDLIGEDGTLSERVKGLFGSAPPVIVRAVARFLAQRPGELDHRCLRTIAEAAPAIDDPKLVAQLIEEMPITQVHLTTFTPPLLETRAGFTKILGRYPRKVRKQLVQDLVTDALLRDLEYIPPKRMTEAGRAVIEAHVMKRADGSVLEMRTALASLYATPATFDFVLAEIEKRIDRGTEGTADRPPQKMPLASVADVLLTVLEAPGDAVRPAHIIKAWDLIKRCDYSDEWRIAVVSRAVKRSELAESSAASLIEEINRLSSPSESLVYRSVLLCQKTLPEEWARQIVEKGVINGSYPESAVRTGVLREWTYTPGNTDGQLLPQDMAPDEIDARLARLPSKELFNSAVISVMESVDALRHIGERAGELTPHDLKYLIRNPNTSLADAGVALQLRANSTQKSASTPLHHHDEVSSETRYGYYKELFLSNPHLDADTAIAMIEAEEAPRRERLAMIAVTNAISNARQPLIDALAEMLVTHIETLPEYAEHYSTAMESMLNDVARVARSRNAQERLTHLALNDDYKELGVALARNATVGVDLLERLDARFYDPNDSDQALQEPFVISKSYGPDDVADLLLEGRASRQALEMLVNVCAGRTNAATAGRATAEQIEKCHEALERLASSGMLGDEHWEQLTSADDPHVAIRYASNPECPVGASRLGSPAHTQVATTLEAMDRGLGEWPRPRPNLRWDALPNDEDEELPRTDLTELIDGRVIAGIEFTTPRTIRDMEEIASKMANCVGHFAGSVEDGTSVVAVGRSEARNYAIVWNIAPDGRRLELYEVNTDFNTGEVPFELTQGVNLLTHEVNAAHAAARSPEHHDASTESEIIEAPRAEVGDPDQSVTFEFRGDTEDIPGLVSQMLDAFSRAAASHHETELPGRLPRTEHTVIDSHVVEESETAGVPSPADDVGATTEVATDRPRPTDDVAATTEVDEVGASSGDTTDSPDDATKAKRAPRRNGLVALTSDIDTTGAHAGRGPAEPSPTLLTSGETNGEVSHELPPETTTPDNRNPSGEIGLLGI